MSRSEPHTPEADSRMWSVGWGLCAGWLAAGSTGVLTIALQLTLCWLLLAACVIQARPRFTGRSWTALAALLLFLVVTTRLGGLTEPQLTLTVAATLGFVAGGMTGLAGQVMWSGALSVLALGLFRSLQLAVPVVWMVSDRLGAGLGLLAGFVTDRPLVLGATFGGVDFLLVMVVFCGLWLHLVRPPRRLAAVWAVLAVAIAHGIYLGLLAYSYELSTWLPVDDVPDVGNPYVPPPYSWSALVQQLLPWNLPLVAALLHSAVAMGLVRLGRYGPARSGPGPEERRSPGRLGAGGVVVAALVLSVLAIVWPGQPGAAGLEGKRVVAFPTGQLDWDVPQHDHYGRDAAGTYGALAWLIESLGGELDIPDQWDVAVLDTADVLLVLQPDTSLSPEVQDQIWQYVRGGGALLMVTEGFSPADGLTRRVDELLGPTRILVQRDAAASATVDWWGATRVLGRAATAGLDVRHVRYLSDSGASLEVAWPARPLIVGSWGGSAPEQGAAWTDSLAAQSAAKLGDLVLVAEERMGRGRVIVLGDRTSLTNEGLVDGYGLAQQLLSSLAQGGSGWAEAVGAAGLGLGLLVLWLGLWRAGSPRLVVVCCAVLAVALAVERLTAGRASGGLPDGTRIASLASDETAPPGNRLAYIDATHLEPYSRQAWGFDALNGLALNLYRNGYLPLLLHDCTAARLNRAGLLVSIGPGREFSASEGRVVQDFVQQGGVLISLVGAEEVGASAGLLADFNLRVPRSPVPTRAADPEPEPFGRTRAEYLEVEPDDGEPYRVGIRLFAAWPVEAWGEEAEVLAYGRNTLPVVQSEAELPVVLQRAFGAGQVVVIGDTCFAMNKNLEYIGGQPFSGGYENAHFWRWLLARLRHEPEWVPPRPPPAAALSPALEDADADEDEEG